MTTNRFLIRFLTLAIFATLAVLCLCLAVCSAAPLVDALPDALPDAIAATPPPKVIEIPITAEVRREPIKKVWGIVAMRPGPCPTCPPVPEYGWIEREAKPTLDEAALELSSGKKLSAERIKILSDIIDAPARAKHWSPGTCGMLGCKTHPGREVYDDEEPQAETDAKTVPWGNEGGRFRLFRYRR